MHIRKQLALLVVVIVAGFGVMAAAQAKKAPAKGFACFSWSRRTARR